MAKKIKEITHIKNKKKRKSRIIKNTSKVKKIVTTTSKSPITRIKKAKGVFRSIRKATKDVELKATKNVDVKATKNVDVKVTKQGEIKVTKTYSSKTKVLKGLVGKNVPINIASKLNQKRWKNALNKVGLRTFTNSRGELRIVSEKRAIYYESLKGKNLADISNIIKRRNEKDGEKYLKKQLYGLTYIQLGKRKILSKALKNAIQGFNIDRKTQTFLNAIKEQSTLDRLNVALSPEYQKNLIDGVDWWKNNDCIDNETKRSLAQEHILTRNLVGSQQDHLFDQFGNRFVLSPKSNRVKLVTQGSRASEFATKDQIENPNEWIQLTDQEYSELLRQHALHITGTTTNSRKAFNDFVLDKNDDQIFNNDCLNQKRLWKQLKSHDFEESAKDFNLAYRQDDDYDEESFYSEIKNRIFGIKSKLGWENDQAETTGKERAEFRRKNIPGFYEKFKYHFGKDRALQITSNSFYHLVGDDDPDSVFNNKPANWALKLTKKTIIEKLGSL